MFCLCEYTQENYRKQPTLLITPTQLNPPKNCNTHYTLLSPNRSIHNNTSIINIRTNLHQSK